MQGTAAWLHFSEGDLGTPLAADKVPAHIRPLMRAAAKAAAPATPEQSAPAKASRKDQPAGIPGGAPKRDRSPSAQGVSASQAAPEADEQPGKAAIPAGPTGRPEACMQHPAGEEVAASLRAQVHLASASQETPSLASAPLPKPAQPEQPSVLTRPLSEMQLGQRPQAEIGQADIAVKKQKHIIPTSMTSAPSAALAATSCKDCQLMLRARDFLACTHVMSHCAGTMKS